LHRQIIAFKQRQRGNTSGVDDLHEHLRAVRRHFRRRLDEAAEGPGAELVDLSVVETKVSEAIEEIERASRELSVAETQR
jgi:hypothetical protein